MNHDLLGMLRRAADRWPDRGLHFFQGREEVDRLPFAQLLEDAGRLSSGLRNRTDLQRGERVALVLPTSADGIRAFFGLLAAGAVPVPMPPPLLFSRPERYAERIRAAAERSGIRLMLASGDMAPFLESTMSAGGPGMEVLSIPALFERGPSWVELSPDEPAMVQYTSGSTTAPRGAVLTHRMLLSNLESIRRGLDLTPSDVCCSWLPLFHDMGLIGCLMSSMHAGMQLLLMPPESFVLDPGSWLSLFGRFKATITTAPNAAYLYCVKRVSSDQVKELDLSSCRSAMNGAEGVDPVTARRFIQHFGPAHFRPEAVMPVYGLAEAVLAVSFTPLGRGLRTVWVHRTTLGRGVVELVPEGHPEGREIASVGVPVHGTEIRLVDPDGQPTPVGRIGEIRVQGASVMAGYDRSEEATGAALRDGWLLTGDLGFYHEGELYITGRLKELLIINGQNYYATDIEQLLRRVPGVGEQGTLALSVPANSAEALVVLAETREKDEARRQGLVGMIREAISGTLGISPSDVVLIARGELPRTSSGKLARHQGFALYERLRGASGSAAASAPS